MSIDDKVKLEKAMNLLDRAAEAHEAAPDAQWFKEYFLLGGQHMILTDEGWESGEAKEYYLADDPDWEPLDEVNAPQREEARDAD
jgi:hypothetical protein